jgi:hypothetical protein
MIHIKAPNDYPDIESYSIFLGGSIEMGVAEHWQNRLVADLLGEDVLILNPRRDDWDSSWKQDPTPGTQFYEQVAWELQAQSYADLLVYYFDPATTSPITLLELGAFGGSDPDAVIVCCPTNYFRYGNVHIFCEWYGIEIVHSYAELLERIKHEVKNADF